MSALAGAAMFSRWRRLGKADRGRVWWLYGWFSGLMMCGSFVGVVAWVAKLMFLGNSYKAIAIQDPVQRTSMLAVGYSWHSVYTVTYAAEFLCLSAAKLMVLDRLSLFAVPQGSRWQKQLAAAGRIVMAAVVLGNAVGLVANVAAAVYYQKSAEAMSAASAYYAYNDTINADRSRNEVAKDEWQSAGSIASVQSFCEVVVLLLIVIAFVICGFLSARRVSSLLLAVDAASTPAVMGRALRLQMVGVTAFVFVTFVVRSVFSTMYAVVNQLREYNKQSCGRANMCSECYNVFTHIEQWMFYTPEFQSTIVLISSPLALLVALWGMTSKHTLQLMKSTTLAVDRPLLGVAAASNAL